MAQFGIANTSNMPAWMRNNQRTFASGIRKIAPRAWGQILMMTDAMKKGNILTGGVMRDAFQGINRYSLTLAAAAPATAKGTTQQLSVTADSLVMPNQVHELSTGEHIFVISVTGNTITVVRGMGQLPALAVPAGERSFHISDAFEESSLRPAGMTFVPTFKENITQIYRHTWAVSGSMASVVNIFGQTFQMTNEQDVILAHSLAQELGLIFGQMNDTVKTHHGQPLRTSDGLIAQIRKHAPQNISQAPNVLTYTWLSKWVRKMFDIIYNQSESMERTVYVDNQAMAALQVLGRNQGTNMTNPQTNIFGQVFRTFQTETGVFHFVLHPLLNLYANTFPSRAGQMLILDLAAISYGTLPGRDGRWGDFNMGAGMGGLAAADGHAADMGIDAQGRSILTESSNLLLAPAACGYLWGIQEAGCEPCIVATTWTACLTVDKPCGTTKVLPGEVVKVSISGGKPSVAVNVLTPSGIRNVTLDTAGAATFDFTATSEATQVFAIVANDIAGLGWSQATASVCVAPPCDPTAMTDPLQITSTTPAC